MEVPEQVLAIVRKAIEAYPDNISNTAEIAEKDIRKLKDFPKFVDTLVREAIRERIYDMRCQMNKELRGLDPNMEKNTAGPSKVVVGDSQTVRRAALSVYHFFIAGRTLGSFFGRELLEVANNERSKSEGHDCNARLIESLVKLIPRNKRVRDAISEAKLRNLFRQCQIKSNTA